MLNAFKQYQTKSVLRPPSVLTLFHLVLNYAQLERYSVDARLTTILGISDTGHPYCKWFLMSLELGHKGVHSVYTCGIHQTANWIG